MESTIDTSHQQPDSDDHCNFCALIKNALETISESEWVIILDDVIDQPCHQHLLQHLRNTFPVDEKLTLVKISYNGVVLYRDDFSKAKEVNLLQDGSTAVATGLVPDKDWVNLNQLRAWKTECLTSHSRYCCNPLGISRVTPAWLIDTLHDCLVPGNDIADFVTLSYVWGASPYLRNEWAILPLLKEPGGLSHEQLPLTVSPMIRHAMGLVRALGERYLWADALCIVQDDAEQTARQLRHMGRIYASATFTIVATDGDASEGIPGIRGVSRSRNLHHTVLPFASTGKLMVHDGTLTAAHFAGEVGSYYKRAWTYQEYAMSQRLLVIGKGQFHWICSSAAFRENLASDCSDLRMEQYRYHILTILSGKPDLKELMRVTRDYNGRDHSFPEDALAGITGILEIFKWAFGRRFLYGLPLMYFHAALMWRTSAPRLSQRRRHSGKTHSILQGSSLPSWSWLGWKDSCVEMDENGGELGSSSHATFGLGQWYSHETPTSINKRAIGPCFPGTILAIEGDTNTLDSPLADGWTAHTCDSDFEQFEPLMSENTIYRHSSLPGSMFWHWFPINWRPAEWNTATTCQHAFISCKTQRAWFRVRIDLRKYGNSQVHAEIYDINKNVCGWLQASSREHEAELSPVDSDQYGLVELVAICLRKASGADSTDFPGVSPGDRFGCLWVEWVDGVAYRKGVGEIEKDSWESHDLEDIDLVLG